VSYDISVLSGDATMYLYEFDIALEALDDRFRLEQLDATKAKPASDPPDADHAQIVAWRDDIYASPSPTTDQCVPWITDALAMVSRYSNQFSTNDFSSIQYYLNEALRRCS
jgi:hypothetical protein